MQKSSSLVKQLTPFAVLAVIVFYVIPLACKLMPSDSAMAVLVLLLLLMSPGYSFAGGLMYGWLYGFSLWFTLMLLVVFFPSIFIIYNSSAMIYLAIFGVLAVVGTGIGAFAKKKQRS